VTIASLPLLGVSTAHAEPCAVQAVAFSVTEPTPTPCPETGPLGPTSDDEGGGTSDATKAGLVVAAIALIAGGVVLRRRATRD
jgi:hypothetical protein